MKENPLISGLAIGAGTSLLSSLFSGSSGSSGSSGGTGVNNTFCASGQYYYSANPPAGDPCAVYSAGGSGTSLPTSGVSGTDLSSLLNNLGTQNTPTINVNVPTSTQPNVSDLLNGCPTVSVLLACPDGEVLQDQGKDANGCNLGPTCVPNSASSSPLQAQGPPCGSSFCPADMYCSSVQPGQCVPNGRVDCGSYSCDQGTSCGADGQCTPDNSNASDLVPVISNSNLYDNNTSSTTPDASQTDLNQKQIPVPEGGIHGDLLSFGGGATIFASNRASDTEVSGFFGGSGAPSLCQRRPWASNFLSYVIPPSFFDGLCQAAGFGGTTPASGSNGGLNTAQTISGPGVPNYTPPAPQTGVQPDAKIRASPPNVNVGGRTTIFWTSNDVSSCQESSSDGNFSGNSVNGGASTVSLSGPVVFYIRCLGIDGNYVTDSTTVNIGI